ncbi:hypothetical protein ABQE45_03380 [Mycobacteroides chelonae]
MDAGRGSGRQRAKVRDLEARLPSVETQRDQYRDKLRAAVRHIRSWMAWAAHHAPKIPTPELPDELSRRGVMDSLAHT